MRVPGGGGQCPNPRNFPHGAQSSSGHPCNVGRSDCAGCSDCADRIEPNGGARPRSTTKRSCRGTPARFPTAVASSTHHLPVTAVTFVIEIACVRLTRCPPSTNFREILTGDCRALAAVNYVSETQHPIKVCHWLCQCIAAVSLIRTQYGPAPWHTMQTLAEPVALHIDLQLPTRHARSATSGNLHPQPRRLR